MTQPLAIDLYCGLGGWTEGFIAEGYRVIGFDIERHDYGTGRYPGELILADVLKLHGSQFADADCIVASPPCTEYSYMAMPWSRSKQIASALRGKGEFPEGYTGSRTIEALNQLFMACFRIQREASQASGREIPMIVENVRGAQPWVSRANASFGSYYLWGDVGMVGKRVVAGVPRFGVSVQPMRHGGAKAPPGNASSPLWKDREISRPGAHATPEEAAALAAWVEERDGTEHGSGSWFAIADSKNRGARTEGFTTAGMNWSNQELRGQDFTRIAGKQAAQKIEGYSDPRRNGGKGAHLTSQRENELRGVTAAQRYREGVKQEGISGPRNNGKGDKWFQDGAAQHGSKSNSRKAASAEIAKIPFPLAQHIAKSFKYAGRLLETAL